MVAKFRKSMLIFLAGLIIGFGVERIRTPERVVHSESTTTLEKISTELATAAKTLSDSSIDERVRETVVEKPDGTKISTTERETISSTTVQSIHEMALRSVAAVEQTRTKRTEQVLKSKFNEIGLRAPLSISVRDFSIENPSLEIFGQAGLRCPLSSVCFIGASYNLSSSENSVEFGVKVPF